jgi:hypothetical protein
MLILLNDVKFKDLQLVIQFMYKGEVKVADSDMPQFLSLGKMLQVKGLCSVELQENQNSVDEGRNGDTKEAQISLTEKPVNDKTKISESKKVTCNKIVQVGQGTKTKTKETPTVAKKRKLRSPSPAEAKVSFYKHIYSFKDNHCCRRKMLNNQHQTLLKTPHVSRAPLTRS